MLFLFYYFEVSPDERCKILLFSFVTLWGHIQNLQIRFNLIVTDVLSYCDGDAKSNLLTAKVIPNRLNETFKWFWFTFSPYLCFLGASSEELIKLSSLHLLITLHIVDLTSVLQLKQITLLVQSLLVMHISPTICLF